jgi:hypothetical protein
MQAIAADAAEIFGGNAPIAPVAHPTPFSVLRFAARTADSAPLPLTRRGLTSFRSLAAPRRRTLPRHFPRQCALSRALPMHLSSTWANAASRGYGGNSVARPLSAARRRRAPPPEPQVPIAPPQAVYLPGAGPANWARPSGRTCRQNCIHDAALQRTSRCQEAGDGCTRRNFVASRMTTPRRQRHRHSQIS